MSKILCKNGSLRYGAVVVSEITEINMSGITMQTATKDPAFGDTRVSKEATGVADGGNVSANGNHDPADTTGQDALATACAAGTHLTTIYLYENTSTFWRVTSGGFLVCTQANSVTMPRSGFAKTSYTFEVSDGIMEKVGTGS